MPTWMRILFVTLGLIVGITPAGYYLWGMHRAAVAAHWPHAPGRILEARLEIEESSETDTGGHGYSRATYAPHIGYSYQVAGRTLRNDRIWLTTGLIFNSRSEGEAFLAAYRPGSPVSVRYDPADPGESCLLVNRPALLVLAFCPVGLILIACAFLFPNEGGRLRLPRRLRR